MRTRNPTRSCAKSMLSKRTAYHEGQEDREEHEYFIGYRVLRDLRVLRGSIYFSCVVSGFPFSMTKLAIALTGVLPWLMPSCTFPASTCSVSPALYVIEGRPS